MGAHVVVAGGGITGLVAAHRLVAAGCEVTVVEPERVGGKIRTSEFAGRPVDEGADAFLLRVPWARALCAELGMDRELTSPSSRAAYVWTRGALRPFPSGHVLGVPTDLAALAASGVVGAAGVERASRDLERPAGPGDPSTTGADVAIGPYLRGRLGDEVVDHLIDPLVGGINAGDIERLSLAAVVPQLDAAARSGDPSLIRSCRDLIGPEAIDQAAPIFAAPLDGMVRLVDALVIAMPTVELRVGRRVASLEPAPSKRAGGPGRPSSRPPIRVGLDDGTSLPADALVLATPAFATAELVRQIDGGAADLLDGIGYASVALLAIAVRTADVGRVLDGSGFVVPRAEGLRLTACSWTTSKWAHLRRGDDTVILRASVGRAGAEEALDLDDADLVEAVLVDLDRTMDLRGAPTAVRVSRWDRSFPQYAPAHLDRVTTLERQLAEVTPGIVVAGAAYRGLGVPACIRQGTEAADHLLGGHLGGRRPVRTSPRG